jgi:YtkA-like protein
MRRLVLALATAAVALAAAGTALAGGWATVGVSPGPPDGGGPGSTWNVDLNVLQHGRTPLDGVVPTITIHNRDNGATQTFTAKPTGEPGHYAAKVVFPSAGTWEYSINDGFSQTHTFKAITIGDAPAATSGRDVREPAPVGDSSSFSVPWTIAGSAAILLAIAALFLIARRPPRTQPPTAPATPR